MIKSYKQTHKRRKVSVRSGVSNTQREHRLVIHKTNKYLYAQMLKLATGKTLFGVKAKTAAEAGKLIAHKAKTAKISEVVFDRGKNRYHGNIKLLADAAREGGLKF